VAADIFTIDGQMRLSCRKFGVAHCGAAQGAVLNIVFYIMITIYIVLLCYRELVLLGIFVLMAFHVVIFKAKCFSPCHNCLNFHENIPVIICGIIWARNLFHLHHAECSDSTAVVAVAFYGSHRDWNIVAGDIVRQELSFCKYSIGFCVARVHVFSWAQSQARAAPEWGVVS